MDQNLEARIVGDLARYRELGTRLAASAGSLADGQYPGFLRLLNIVQSNLADLSVMIQKGYTADAVVGGLVLTQIGSLEEIMDKIERALPNQT